MNEFTKRLLADYPGQVVVKTIPHFDDPAVAAKFMDLVQDHFDETQRCQEIIRQLHTRTVELDAQLRGARSKSRRLAKKIDQLPSHGRLPENNNRPPWHECRVEKDTRLYSDRRLDEEDDQLPF